MKIADFARRYLPGFLYWPSVIVFHGVLVVCCVGIFVLAVLTNMIVFVFGSRDEALKYYNRTLGRFWKGWKNGIDV